MRGREAVGIRTRDSVVCFPLSRSLLGTVRDSTREARVGFAYVRILPAIGVELMEHASHTRAHARLTCCSGPYGIASMSSAHAVRGDMLVGEGGAIRICDVFILLTRAFPPPPQPSFSAHSTAYEAPSLTKCRMSYINPFDNS